VRQPSKKSKAKSDLAKERPRGEDASVSEVPLPRKEQTRLRFPGWLPFGLIRLWDFA
jgi:hypothetical protein